MEQPWVIIVAISPKASDSQSVRSGLAVRPHGLTRSQLLHFKLINGKII